MQQIKHDLVPGFTSFGIGSNASGTGSTYVCTRYHNPVSPPPFVMDPLDSPATL